MLCQGCPGGITRAGLGVRAGAWGTLHQSYLGGMAGAGVDQGLGVHWGSLSRPAKTPGSSSHLCYQG